MLEEIRKIFSERNPRLSKKEKLIVFVYREFVKQTIKNGKKIGSDLYYMMHVKDIVTSPLFEASLEEARISNFNIEKKVRTAIAKLSLNGAICTLHDNRGNLLGYALIS